MSKFYGDFAAAYGTCWLVVMAAAVLTTSHIDTGRIGGFGFPAVSLIYALSRRGYRSSEVDQLRQSVERLEAKLVEQQSASTNS